MNLNESTITKNSHQLLSGKELLLNIDNLTFDDTFQFLYRKDMLNKNILAIRFLQHPFLDELFEDDDVRPVFESFLFDVLERGQQNRFMHFVFKLKNNDLETLIHNGFYEWIEYWMLFFRFSKVNFIFELDDDTLNTSRPMGYQIAKRINNPRISLFVNTDNWNNYRRLIPEDLNAFVSTIKNENMKFSGALQYATMYVNPETTL